MKISKSRLKEIIKEEVDDLFNSEKETILESLSDNTITNEERILVQEGFFDLFRTLINKQENPVEKQNLLAVQTALNQLEPSTLNDVQTILKSGVTITGNPNASRTTPWELMETE